MASYVCEDLGSLEAKLADGFAVFSRLLGSSRRGKLNVISTELVQGLCNLDLLGGVEVSIGKLLAFS